MGRNPPAHIHMLKIEIEIPQPVATALLLCAVAGAVVWVRQVTVAQEPSRGDQGDHMVIRDEARGGPTDESREQVVLAAEAESQVLRTQQAILRGREEILRAQLQSLQEERKLRSGGLHPVDEEEFRKSEDMLRQLLIDQEESEKQLLQSLEQLWEAEGIARATVRHGGAVYAHLAWPVEPEYGISASFHDSEYEEMFGIPHGGTDIPVMQGTIVRAAADGIVEKVADNGYGFNSVTIMHDGYATLYGHVTSFLVEEGATVRQGDPVALSGGRPGTPGAGSLTTGPHLHFELFVDGARVDPQQYLPYLAALENEQ